MSVVRRGAVGAVVAGLVLLGGPAWAQEDPCAPGPDGSVPEMCQSGPQQPTSDTGTVGMEPDDPCVGSRPVEPGDGVVSDGGGSDGVAEGEPAPDTEPDREEPAQPGQTEPEPRPEPAPDEPMPPSESAGEPDRPVSHDPAADGEDVVMCAFGIPVSDTGTPESATSGRGTAAAGQLPRTGPYDGLLALTALGSALVLVGAGATAVARRRAQV